MDNMVPRTKYAHYTKRELLSMFEQCKTDPDYTEELRQRLARSDY